MKSIEAKKISRSPLIAFAEIPFEGLELELSESFGELYRADEPVDPGLAESFKNPILVKASLVPVGSKVDLRGSFQTVFSGICDRCTGPVAIPLAGSLTTFLMAKTQFSEHDKPGGKVIHGPTRGIRPSRHHSKSKAPILTDAEGEHEDENFGAFDGQTVDLRPLIRELLILQIPMKTLCDDQCRGLCLVCAGNLNQGKCTCLEGPTFVKADEEGAAVSQFAAALASRKEPVKTF